MLARGRLSLLISAVLGLLVLLASTSASAKATHESPYTFEQTFGTTLRLLKVDLELEVTESNSDWGYLLFVYVNNESGDRKNRASFTFVRDGDMVQVALQIPEMPSYHEQMVMERLERKLVEEHGDPPPPVKKVDKPKKKKKKDDDSKDEDEDEDESEDGKDDD